MQDQNKIDLKDVNKTKKQIKLPKLNNPFKKQSGQKRDEEGKFATTTGSGGLLKSKNFNLKRALPIMILVALVGGYMVFRSFAATLPTPQNGRLLIGGYSDGSTPAYAYNNHWYDISNNSFTKVEWLNAVTIQGGAFGFSSDGKEVYVRNGFHSPSFKVVAYNASDGSNERVIADDSMGLFASGEVISNAVMTSDRKQIILVTIDTPPVTGSYTPVQKNAYIINTDGSGFRKILSGEEYRNSDIRPTYDNKLLVLGKSQPYIFDPATGVKMPEFQYNIYIPSPTKPEAFTYGTDTTKLYIKNYETGTTRTINKPLGYSGVGPAEWSPDGKYLVAFVEKPSSDRLDGYINSLAVLDATTGQLVVELAEDVHLRAWQPLPPSTPPPAPVTTYTENSSKLTFTTTGGYITKAQDTPEGAKRAMDVLLVSAKSRANNAKVSMTDRTALNNFLTTQKAAGKKVKVCASVRVPTGTSSLRLLNILGKNELFNVPAATKYAKQCTTAGTIGTISSTSPVLPWLDVKYADMYVETMSVEVE